MKLSIEQLEAVCEDIKYTLDVIRVVKKTMGPRAPKALEFRRAYLRDIHKLLSE